MACERGQVLLDADSSLEHIYFPDSGVISIVAVYPDGSIIEMATIGREGATGPPGSARCQGLLGPLAGPAARHGRSPHARSLHASDAGAARFPRSHARPSACVPGAGAGIGRLQWCTQHQAAAGTLALDDARPPRRGYAPDHPGSPGGNAGCAQATISKAAGPLHRRRFIELGRKRVVILDRDALIKEACECYQLVRLRIAHHLPNTYPE